MVAENYQVSADVLRRTLWPASSRMPVSSGPVKRSSYRITVFDMAEQVEEGDNEVMIARWSCEKEKLI